MKKLIFLIGIMIHSLSFSQVIEPYVTANKISGDYVEVTVDSMKYINTFWDDQQVNLGTIRLTGGSNPDQVNYRGGQVLAFSSTTDEYASFNTQLTHRYEHGSAIEFHMHYVLPSAPVVDDSVVMVVTYSWATIGEAFPVETTVSTTIDVQSLSADTHYLGELIGRITGTGKKGSSMLICSIERDADNASDTYDFDLYLIGLDFHIEIDKPGSWNEYP